MKRRELLGAMGVGAAAYLLSPVQWVFAGSDAAKLYIEGWKIAADPEPMKKHGFFSALAQVLSFEHLYLKLQDGQKWVYFAGFPTDPQTGAITNMLRAGSCLGVHVLSEKENESLRQKHALGGLQSERSVFPAKPVTRGTVSGEPIQRASSVTIAGALLDMAAAINAAGLSYVPAQVNASPPNSNAVVAALLAQVGYCQKDSCRQLQQDFSQALAPGINHGLALEVKPGQVYADMAKQKGMTVDTLVKTFKSSSAARPQRPAKPLPKGMVSSDPGLFMGA